MMIGLAACGGPPREIDFNADIRPILNESCVDCHGGVRRRADLNLLFRDDALQPAKSGKAAIVPGDPDASELMKRVLAHDPDDRMPKAAPRLADDQVALLRRWIADGAQWERHWSYVAPERPALGTIDAFVRRRLNSEGLNPSPEADCSTLIRRVSLDLVGLPPSVADVEAACQGSNDVDESRYARHVDKLLASPRFGERWASMWLDLARYADSQGYEKDGPRSISRYRDWVIKAFNADKPFDRFTIEQLAGDLLPNATTEQRIATAFSRNSMTNTEGGTDDEEHRVASVIDRVNTTFEVWQATSLKCAQCHGHPYDPIRHEEYYQLFAFFNNTADWDQELDQPLEREFPLEHRDNGKRLLARLDSINAAMQAHAAEPEMRAERAEWELHLDDPDVVGAVRNTWQNELLRVADIPREDRTPAQRAYSERIFAEVRPEFKDLRDARNYTAWMIGELHPTTTPIMQELPPDQRRVTHVFERGNFLLPTDPVQPDVPNFLPPLFDGTRVDTTAPTRLDLANWLVADENPLTARVIVNRFWAQLFGTGIVETLEDFGTQGSRPSHPELLDWLAVEFRETQSWSVKGLLRTIVMSHTYRQSSDVTPELTARDPQNKLLARGPRFRLSAEQVRDQALAVSGLLSDAMYGESVMPPQPEGIWQNPYSNAQWETDEGEDRHRRALYTYWRRTAPYPSMITFDSPSRELCVSRRPRTNTPLQALVTLNDPAFFEAARALAMSMTSNEGSTDDRLAGGYRRALLAEPTPSKAKVLRDLYDDALEFYRGSPDEATKLVAAPEATAEQAAMVTVANAILNLDEFLSKG